MPFRLRSLKPRGHEHGILLAIASQRVAEAKSLERVPPLERVESAFDTQGGLF